MTQTHEDVYGDCVADVTCEPPETGWGFCPAVGIFFFLLLPFLAALVVGIKILGHRLAAEFDQNEEEEEEAKEDPLGEARRKAAAAAEEQLKEEVTQKAKDIIGATYVELYERGVSLYEAYKAGEMTKKDLLVQFLKLRAHQLHRRMQGDEFWVDLRVYITAIILLTQFVASATITCEGGVVLNVGSTPEDWRAATQEEVDNACSDFFTSGGNRVEAAFRQGLISFMLKLYLRAAMATLMHIFRYDSDEGTCIETCCGIIPGCMYDERSTWGPCFMYQRLLIYVDVSDPRRPSPTCFKVGCDILMICMGLTGIFVYLGNSGNLCDLCFSLNIAFIFFVGAELLVMPLLYGVMHSAVCLPPDKRIGYADDIEELDEAGDQNLDLDAVESGSVGKSNRAKSTTASAATPRAEWGDSQSGQSAQNTGYTGKKWPDPLPDEEFVYKSERVDAEGDEDER